MRLKVSLGPASKEARVNSIKLSLGPVETSSPTRVIEMRVLLGLINVLLDFLQ